jgi:hypothetical protein
LELRRRLAVTAPMAAFVLAELVAPSSVLAVGTDLLPDLQMAPIYGMELRTSASGHKHLRFGTIVYNVGDGAMEVRARDRDGDVMRRVVQWIYRDDDTGRGILKSDAKVFYAGDGHDHWHIAKFNKVTVTPLPGTPGDGPRRLRKIGFCLVDSVVMQAAQPGVAGAAAYFGCGDHKSTSVKMGISVGYGDIYAPETKFQAIDVTGLPAGSYRICATTNPRGLWTEKAANFTNNSSWTDIDMDVANDQLTVTDTGQGPC